MDNHYARRPNRLKAIFIAFIFITAGFSTAKAQTCNASFTYTIGAAGNVSFTNTSTGGLGPFYYWYFGDNFGDFSASPSHTFANGTYVVCLTMYDSLSTCQSMFCDTIVITNNNACNASFNFAIGSSGVSVYFASTSGTGPNAYYLWDFGDNTQDTGFSTYHTYTAPGNYNVCLYIADQATNCMDTFCQNVNILWPIPTCNAAFSYTGSGTNIMFSNQSVTSSGFPSYTWTFGDNTSSTVINPVHSYAQPGTYIVCLSMTVQDSLGVCQDTYCDTLVITGVNDPVFEKSVRVFPNPADNRVDLEYQSGNYDWITIELFSADGRVMDSQRQQGGSGVRRVHFDTDDMAQGIYFIKISTAEFSTTRRVSVIH